MSPQARPRRQPSPPDAVAFRVYGQRELYTLARAMKIARMLADAAGGLGSNHGVAGLYHGGRLDVTDTATRRRLVVWDVNHQGRFVRRPTPRP